MIITAHWEGMGDVGLARYEPALLSPCPTIRVLSYINSQRSTHSISEWIFRNLALEGLLITKSCINVTELSGILLKSLVDECQLELHSCCSETRFTQWMVHKFAAYICQCKNLMAVLWNCTVQFSSNKTQLMQQSCCLLSCIKNSF